jgi:dTDP-4-amino-4,6-dideoxygalactose transaminase
VLEDAAEALGATHDGRSAGSFGYASVLSFNGNKIMTTSGGGMLLSDDLGLISMARYLSTQARQPVDWYEHTDIGYNYRLSNVLAALGRAQLSRLDQMAARRRAIRNAYVAGLSDLAGVRFLGLGPVPRPDNCWLTCIEIDPDRAVLCAAELIGKLQAEDIEAKHVWKPMHRQPVFAEARAFVTGAADRLFQNGVALPSGSALSDSDIARVIDVVRVGLRR